jgi:hypothetical protein
MTFLQGWYWQFCMTYLSLTARLYRKNNLLVDRKVLFFNYFFLCIILLISLSVICLVPCPGFVWVLLGSLPVVLIVGLWGVVFVERCLPFFVDFVLLSYFFKCLSGYKDHKTGAKELQADLKQALCCRCCFMLFCWHFCLCPLLFSRLR